VLLVAVLHFIESGEEVSKIIGILREEVAAGSYLVLTNAPAEPDLSRVGSLCGVGRTPG
jgi:S-adenosyl methyltransferase